MDSLSDRYFVASGYSADDASEPDLFVFRISEGGQIFPMFSMHLGCNPSYVISHRHELIAAGEEPNRASVTYFDWDGNTLVCLREHSFPYSGLCHLCAMDNIVYGSTYGSGVFFCADAYTGSVLWEYRSSGTEVHAHGIFISEDKERLFTADLGSGEIGCFMMNKGVPNRKLCSYTFTGNEGPRHLFIEGKRLYCTLENTSQIAALSCENDSLVLEGIYMTTEKPIENYPSCSAAVNGSLLVGNRGADSIALFGKTERGLVFRRESRIGGRFPRHIYVTPDRRFILASCQKSGCVCVCDAESLKVTDELPLHGASCTCILDTENSR